MRILEYNTTRNGRLAEELENESDHSYRDGEEGINLDPGVVAFQSLRSSNRGAARLR